MAPLPCIDLPAQAQGQLLGIARQALDHAVANGDRLSIDLDALPACLHRTLGVFVTLTAAGDLRGCIGTLQSADPLALSVVDAAHGAALRDPRFQQLQAEELPITHIEISVLSELQPIVAADRETLLTTLRPNTDGLLLEDGSRRATFLPKVWEQLPDADHFLDHLLAKAGLTPGHWSPGLRLQRYQALSFAEPL